MIGGIAAGSEAHWTQAHKLGMPKLTGYNSTLGSRNF